MKEIGKACDTYSSGGENDIVSAIFVVMHVTWQFGVFVLHRSFHRVPSTHLKQGSKQNRIIKELIILLKNRIISKKKNKIKFY